jgi:hypothetical protein
MLRHKNWATIFYRAALAVGLALSAMLFAAGMSFGFLDIYFASAWGIWGLVVMANPLVGFAVRQSLPADYDTPRNIVRVGLGIITIVVLHLIVMLSLT